MIEKEIIQRLRQDAVEIIKAIPESGKVHLQVEYFNAVFPEIIVHILAPKGDDIDSWPREVFFLSLTTDDNRLKYNRVKAEIFEAIARFDKMMEA